MHCVEESNCDIVGTFRRPPVIRCPGHCSPCPSRYIPGKKVTITDVRCVKLTPASSKARKLYRAYFIENVAAVDNKKLNITEVSRNFSIQKDPSRCVTILQYIPLIPTPENGFEEGAI